MTRCCWRGDCAPAICPSSNPNYAQKHVSAFFEYRLINHLKLEEELLFPAFRAVLGVEASLIDLLLSDHRELPAQATAIKAGAHDQVLDPLRYVGNRLTDFQIDRPVTRIV